jgi:uncharacterized protein YjbI with pentapeptide repeats
MSGKTSIFLGKFVMQTFLPVPLWGGWPSTTLWPGGKMHVAAIDADCFCVWAPPSEVLQPNGPWQPSGPQELLVPSSTRITLLTRLSDGALCFLMNTGQYVGFKSGYLPLVDDLSSAAGFAMTNPLSEDPRTFSTFTQFVSATDSNLFIGAEMLESQPVLTLVAGNEDFFQIYGLTPSTQTILSNKNGDGFDLSGVDFTEVDFSGCSFKGAEFSRCNLIGTILNGTNLTNADLSGATLTGTHLAGAVMHGTKFDGVDLTATDFGPTPDFRPPVVVPPTATNPRTSFAKAKLPVAAIGLNWSMLDLSGTELIGTGDLSGVNAQYAKLSGAGLGLSGRKLVGANFSHADIGDDSDVAVDFSNSHFSATLDEPVSTFAGATLHNTNFSGAKLVGANFKNIQGSRTDTAPGANFSSAYLVNAILTESNLVKTSFSGAQLYGTAQLDHANLQQADFSNSILAGLNLNEAHLRGAIFDGAILVNASLREVELTPTADGNATRFVSANLIGTDFSGAHLDSANLDNAVVALSQGVPLFVLAQLASWGPDLDRNHVSAALRAVFQENGQPLRESAAVYTVTLGSEWVIEQYPAYDLKFDPHLGRLSVAISSVEVLTIPASAAFVTALDNATLAPELVNAIESLGAAISTSAQIDVVTAGSAWALTQVPSVANAIGYSRLSLAIADGNLMAFGTELMVSRPGPDNKLQLEIVDVDLTKLTPDELGLATICPNRSTYAENVANGTSWTRMMTAPSPPAPPTCVPSPDRWCSPGNV